MARVFTEGFELGSTRWINGSTNQWAASTTTARSGSYSLRSGDGSNGYAYHNITAISEFYFRIGHYHATDDNVRIFYWASGGTELGSFRISSGALQFYLGTGTWVATSTARISWSAWNSFEVHVKIADSGGVLESRINGVPDMSYSGDTKPGTETTVSRIYLNGSNNYNYFDDLALNDTSGSNNNSWCGDGKIVLLRPNAAGDNTQLTPSAGNNWECVDEIPSSSADYVESNTVDYYDLYNLAASGLATGSTINHVQGVATAYDTVAAGGKFQIGLKTESTEYWSSDISMSTSNAWYDGVDHVVNPNTSSAWTITQLDALQIGVKTRGDA